MVAALTKHGTSGTYTAPPAAEPGHPSAFTLLEVATVLTVIGILAAIAVPRYAGFVTGQRADAAARRIIADFAFLRQRARTSSQSYTVSFNMAADSYSVSGLPDPDHKERDYTVSLADEPYGAIIVSADFGGDQEIIFDVFGVPDSGGSVVIRVGNHVRTIVVDADTGKATAQ